jgi:hypothetical protein
MLQDIERSVPVLVNGDYLAIYHRVGRQFLARLGNLRKA